MVSSNFASDFEPSGLSFAYSAVLSPPSGLSSGLLELPPPPPPPQPIKNNETIAIVISLVNLETS
ncbi:MAG: hypothetical protein LBO72_10445 [Helicobacteraceae bacterium]|nr:hypothetical protein [Helicobacteraceae bacterium]